MAEKNTPLINTLLEQVGQHPDAGDLATKGQTPVHSCKVTMQLPQK